MFLGLSATGINREVSFTIESANQCSQHKVQCLAIPRLAVMKMAEQLAVMGMLYKQRETVREDDFEYLPLSQTIARGILPSLSHIVTQEEGLTLTQATSNVVPDCDINTLGTKGAIDPNGSHFFCIICHAELCNVYYQCIGCIKLLDKEFNICHQCYNTKKGKFNDMEMGLDKDTDPSDIKWNTNRHHTCTIGTKNKCGPPKKGKGGQQQKCELKPCYRCLLCSECSCMCHRIFKHHRRFYGKQRVKELLEKCEILVGEDEVPFAVETQRRLDGEKLHIDARVMVPSPYYPNAQKGNGFTR